jgi:hypothetical protein
MKIPKSFSVPHTPDSSAACDIFKRDASRVLRRVAGDLSLRQRDYAIRGRRQKRHRAEVIALHTDSLYLQIEHSTARSTALMSFRTCNGRQDCSGGRDNGVSLDSIDSPEGYARLLSSLRVIAGRRS